MNSINVKQESRTAKDCFRVATTSLALCERAKENWEIEHHAVVGITFTAFSIEAMINHYGRIYYDDWNSNRESRIKSHKNLFKAVNLPSYLGSNEYQVAKKCFELRDKFAHGKTTTEFLEVNLPECSGQDSIVRQIVMLSSIPFRESGAELLENFIDTARKIEKDIENSGYYPNQEHIKQHLRSKLRECPLSVSGVCSWQT